MIRINRNPTARELLTFGLLLGVFTGIFGFLAYFRNDSPALARTIWTIGGGLTLVYFFIPPLRRFIYLGWIYAAFPIGWTVSHIILGIVYYLIVTPIGVAVRTLGNDPMLRRFEETESYWEPHDSPSDVKRYFRQF